MIPDTAMAPTWLTGLRRYLAVSLGAHLTWEVLHLPLYTLWKVSNARELAVAILHCTAGDMLIALSVLASALVAAGTTAWPAAARLRVGLLTLMLGLGYTIFSEWWNVHVTKTWAYSDLMPVVPLTGIGVSPLLQWLVVPAMALAIASRGSRPC
ncbi:MAG: hypothetical protein VX871_09340 [Pseudomonadota bacterium]|nr:hypothetical protein [Pseudomonadota bacterium]